MRRFSTHLIGGLLTFSVMTSSVLNDEANAARKKIICELKGMDLMQAYSRAQNNNNLARCQQKTGNRWRSRDYLLVLPTPNGISCQKTGKSVFNKKYDYRFHLFNRRLKNGWTVTDFSASGGGNKGSGATFYTKKADNTKWKLSINKVWIKGHAANCDKMKSIIRRAFGS